MSREYFIAAYVPDNTLDLLLADGWRHFGTYFFRHTTELHCGVEVDVMPLRIRLCDFSMKKRQQKIWRRNQRFLTLIRPFRFGMQKQLLFEKHKQRFKEHVPSHLFDFLPEHPERPTRIHEVCVYDEERLIAASFIDIGQMATSAIYAMFDPDYASFSLGIYTLLVEIDYARQQGKQYHYLGYAYPVPSHYDYKKQFNALEYYDWKKWNCFPDSVPIPRSSSNNKKAQ
ncbi:arginine-tRNA-protein transferase [Thermonema lapsum]|uniref:Arginine-tRNA-protein transferase n=1 Tax=Thermonema lapsum TaxID=28195 RepID=A0A846MMK0_9BACT|nr:GNAT family N-acetyltransferase [Thermonema lapsum]NIK72766.1 arginine-tRNA-protein transferase [Thermonema lapsum]